MGPVDPGSRPLCCRDRRRLNCDDAADKAEASFQSATAGPSSLRRQEEATTRIRRRSLSVRICTQIGRGLFGGRLYRQRRPLLQFTSVLLNKSLSSICLSNKATTDDAASVSFGSSAVSCNRPRSVLLAPASGGIPTLSGRRRHRKVYRMTRGKNRRCQKGQPSEAIVAVDIYLLQFCRIIRMICVQTACLRDACPLIPKAV